MSTPDDPRRDAPQVIGDPATAVRPGFALEPDAVRAMLRAPSLPPLLELLGITGEDREELLALMPRVLADEEIIEAITGAANALRHEAGLVASVAPLAERREHLNALQERIQPGQGLIAILAHVVGTDVVRAWHAARGMSPAQSWAALADLGQQMRVHRLTYGSLGLHTVFWTALAWAGRLFSIGRLQYDLSRTDGSEGDPPRWVIGTHIPATGPLDPAAVDASLADATAFFTAHFDDLQGDRPATVPAFGHEFRCSSWLLSEELAGIVGEDSNLARFAARWRIRSTSPAADDAAFFVFHARPPYDPATFPRTTRLERGVAERLEDGRGWSAGNGELVR